MSITLTNLHFERVVDQLRTNLIGLQKDMYNNAHGHVAMAQAQSPDFPTLQKYVTNSAAQYLKRLQWVTDLQNDPTRKQQMVNILTKMGWVLSDITSVIVPLQAAATALSNATLTNYQDIITACNALLAAVDAPPSLWPE